MRRVAGEMRGMEEVRIFDIPVAPESLRGVGDGRAGQDFLRYLDPLASDIAARGAGGPFSVYVCSADTDKPLRDHFAISLARAILGRLPGALVVDCDFLSPGLSGAVPNPQALGFLDLVLYGSSLGVIAQRSEAGVSVIGTGSFAVSRRTPFVMDAFDDAARYLCRPAGCVIFCGPATEEGDAAHSIARRVGLPIVVESERQDRATISALASRVAGAKESLVWNVRISQPKEPVEAPEEERPTAPEVEDEVDEILSGELLHAGDAQGVAGDTAGEREAETVLAAGNVPYREETFDERSANSATPRIVTTLLAVVVVGFLLWWLYLTRSMREGADRPVEIAEPRPLPSVERPSVDIGPGAADPVAATGDTAAEGPTSSPPETGGGGEREGGAGEGSAEPDSPVAPERAAAGVQRDFPVARETAPELALHAGKYVIHVSSFRGLAHAQDDANYLQGRGYDPLIAHVDLGDKGLWYRVYVGPFDTEREAAMMKIRLDENPRVRSTRITKIPNVKDES